MSLLIDVRDAEEYAKGHAAGAIHIPLFGIIFGNLGALAEAGKDEQIALYCRSGARAERAKELLAEYGFTDVINLGGLADVL